VFPRKSRDANDHPNIIFVKYGMQALFNVYGFHSNRPDRLKSDGKQFDGINRIDKMGQHGKPGQDDALLPSCLSC